MFCVEENGTKMSCRVDRKRGECTPMFHCMFRYVESWSLISSWFLIYIRICSVGVVMGGVYWLCVRRIDLLAYLKDHTLLSNGKESSIRKQIQNNLRFVTQQHQLHLHIVFDRRLGIVISGNQLTLLDRRYHGIILLKHIFVKFCDIYCVKSTCDCDQATKLR